MTGGIFSLALIVLFMILFMNMLIHTLQRNIITYTVDVEFSDDDALVQFSASDPSNFLFGIEIVGIDLSAQEKYFDIIMRQSMYNK